MASLGQIGALVIELGANTARLSSDMGKAIGIAENGAKKLQAAFKFAGGGLIGATVLNIAKQSIAMGEQLNKAAIKAGVSGEAISQLAYAAKLADIDVASLSGALQKMQVALSKSAGGSKEQTEALAALGLTIGEIKNLAPDRQFEIIADRISQLKDPADRARAAVEIFGKAGAELLPLFEQGAEGIRKAREEAQRLGLSFSAEQLRKLDDAGDAVDRLSLSWQGFAAVLTAKVSPPLIAVLDALSGVNRARAQEEAAKNFKLLSAELKALERQRASIKGKNIDTSELDAKLAATREKIANLLQPIEVGDLVSQRGRRSVPGFEAVAAEAKKSADGLNEYIVKSGRRTTSALDDFYNELEQSTRTSIEQQVSDFARLEAQVRELVNAGRITQEDANRRVNEALDNILKEVEVTAKKTQVPLDQMSEFARQAARNMQDAFADFLFDPFKDGIDGMLKGFVNILRRMAAEALAAKIFDSLGIGTGGGGGGGGLGGLGGILKSITGLFGFANGGQFKVGGSGGTDSQLVAFRASPNETVTVTRPDQRMGGPSIVLNYSPQIDARGADIGLTQRLPAILSEQSRRIFDELDRRYGLRPT